MIPESDALVKMTHTPDEYANGDEADAKEVESEHDPRDFAVDYNGYSNTGYAHTPTDDPKRLHAWHNAVGPTNNIKNLFPDHFATKPREDVQLNSAFEDYPINQEHMNLMYTVTKPSDELANGDSADDKEL